MASGPEASSTSKLYTPRLLALSASLADYPMTGPFDVTADGRSKTCGSTISIGLDCDKVGGISRQQRHRDGRHDDRELVIETRLNTVAKPPPA